MKAVRTRFAPSPTGFLHVGGIRTALFAWLLARQSAGQFILRLEDTDQAREVSGSDQHIMQSLRSLGLDYDEGPDIGGPYGPYRQSERLAIYHEWGQKLLAVGRAYADPFSPSELHVLREQAKQDKRPFLFRDHRPITAPIWDGSQPLRFKSMPEPYSWHDAVMGELSAGVEAVDDFILIKSDGFPTYNFAHIIDDHLMAVSHVIRSQEFLASVPRYLNLYEALEIAPPQLATVPFVIGANGNNKLSKRDGAKDVLDYIREGYLADALVNFIATLGWNDGSEQELFNVTQLIEKFSLEHVQRSGARFDERRLMWMNGVYIRALPLNDLYEQARNYWPSEAAAYDDAYKKQVLRVLQDRLKYLAELAELSRYFFVDLPLNPSLIEQHKQLSKIDGATLKGWLEQAKDSLEQSDFSLDDLTRRLNELLELTSQKPIVLFSLIRIAVTQAPSSPGLADTLAVIGKARSLQRLKSQLN